LGGVTSEGERVWRKVRGALSPSVLREEVVLRLELCREEFVPESLTPPSSTAALMAEVVRFVAHLCQCEYLRSSGAPYPDGLARTRTDEVLNQHLGGLGEGQRVLRRMASDQGMRAVFDYLTRCFEEDRLRNYLAKEVVLPIELLPWEDWLPLATEYVKEFRTLPHVETEHPALVVGRWSKILAQHARIVLGWD
jgi:hypothetical protein